MIIDVHVHTGHMPLFQVEGKIEDLIRSADKNGIDKLFCTEALALFYNLREGNALLYQHMKRYPDRILGYCTISSARYGPEALDELDRCINDYKMCGLKIYSLSIPGTNEPFLSVNDEYMYPLIERAAQYRIPILAHCNAQELRALAPLFPSALFIMAHMGNTAHAKGDWHGAIAVAKKFSNVYLDTSTSSTDMDCIETAVFEVGAGRILFGSDWPLFHHQFALARIRCTSLTPDQQGLILGGNIAKLLHLG